MRRVVTLMLCALGLGLGLGLGVVPARAVELRISARALERMLKNQVFTTPPPKSDLPNRRYLKGSGTSACSVFADTPQVSFAEDRVVVRVHTHANLGAAIHGKCIGIWINTESVVSFVPEAESESIGFRDARVDKLTDARELNVLLEPFLANRMPAEMKFNAADMLRTLLVHAPGETGYVLTLTSLNLRSMQVVQQELVVDLDANVKVN